MGDYSFTFFGPFIGGISIAIVSCIGCVFGIRRCRRRRELEIQFANQSMVLPQQSIPVAMYPAPQQQPYVMSYSQPLAPVGYYPYQQPAYYPYPKPSAPMGPVQV